MRFRLIGALAALAFSSLAAFGQVQNPGVQQSGAVVFGNCTKWGPGTGQIQDAGTACGVGGGVTSFNARTGAVLPAANDYNFNQLAGSLAYAQMPNSGVAAASYGSATQCVALTVNAQGIVTGASAVTCTPAFGSLTGVATAAQLPVGADTGNQLAKTTNYTASNADCNSTISFNVTTLSTLTAGAASGFTAGCKLFVQNVGVYTGPASARGVLLTGVNGVSYGNQKYVLFPGQKTEFTNISNAWVETGFVWRQRWQVNGVNVTFFADAGAGSDTASDGLGTGAGANVTINNAYNRATNNIDSQNGASQVILSTTGSFAANDVLHMAGPIVGGAGNAQFVWNGNGTTTVNGNAGGPCVSAFDNAILEIINLSCINSSSGGCFSVSSGAIIFFITTVSTCDPGTGGAFVMADPGAKVEFVNVGININSSGGAPLALFQIANGSILQFDGAFSISLGNNMAMAQSTVVADKLGLISFGGTTFNLNAHTITGTRFICQRFGVMAGTGGAPNTFIPGNANGTAGADCSAI